MSVSENCGDASSRALSRFLLRFPTPTPVFRLGSASLITSTRLPASSRRSRHRARPLSPHAIMTPLAGSPFPLPPKPQRAVGTVKPSSMISSEGTSERCSPTRDGTCRVCQDAHLADPRPTTSVLRAPSRRLPELHSTPHPPSSTLSSFSAPPSPSSVCEGEYAAGPDETDSCSLSCPRASTSRLPLKDPPVVPPSATPPPQLANRPLFGPVSALPGWAHVKVAALNERRVSGERQRLVADSS